MFNYVKQCSIQKNLTTNINLTIGDQQFKI